MNGIIEFPWSTIMWYDPENILFLSIQFSKWYTIIEFQVRHLDFIDKFFSCVASDWVPSDSRHFFNLWCRVFISLENNIVMKREEVLSSQKLGYFCFILAIWPASAFFKVELKYLCVFGMVITIQIVFAINAAHIRGVSLHLFSMFLKNRKKLTSITVICKSKLSICARMRF